MRWKIRFIVAVLVVSAAASGAAGAVPLLPSPEQTVVEREGLVEAALDWMRSLLGIERPEDLPEILRKERSHVDPDGEP